MDKKLLDKLIEEIKSKKQISFLDNDFIGKKLQNYFLTNGNIRKKLETEFGVKEDKIIKSKLFKEVVKKIREEIGVVYGSFLTQDFNKKKKKIENFEELLKLHKSTRERVEFYDEIYTRIFEWFKPRKIYDLACGLNPCSYEFMKKKLGYDFEYFASDLNPNDMNFLNEFFKLNGIEGIAKNYDLTELNFLDDEELLDCDLCFLFKALDSLEFVKKNISKKILEKLPCERMVVSFPTKSLVSKKEFKVERRNWFVKFIENSGWDYETFEVENELFFLITKA